jgi:hypothetical protein
MARIVSALTGKTRGRIGNTIFSVYGGRTIGREAPASVANPRTSFQTAQRIKVAGVSQILKGYRFLFKSGYRSYRTSSRSRRGTILTHRSHVQQQLMRALREHVIPISSDINVLFFEVLSALRVANFAADMSSAKPINAGIQVGVASIQGTPSARIIEVFVNNTTNEDVIINSIRVYSPVFANGTPSSGVVDSRFIEMLTAPLLVPANTIGESMTGTMRGILGFGLPPEQEGWYVVEALLEGQGIVSNGARELPVT